MTADFDSLDPALAYMQLSAQVLAATCAKLYNFPDASGRAGARSVTEVARGQPRVSREGRRQTFTIRPGLRFSPPSGAPVTARTFRHAIERSVAHKLGPTAPAIPYLGDVVGARAFETGRARHIAGVAAAGDRLVVRSTRPAPDLPLRVSLSLFCAVPDDAPPSRKGISTLPSAGPYSVVSAIRGRQAVLARNPYYRGLRPAHAEPIAGSAPALLRQRRARRLVHRAEHEPAAVRPAAAAPGGELRHRSRRAGALYPLHGDVARARRLAGPGRRYATLVVCNQAPCPQWGRSSARISLGAGST